MVLSGRGARSFLCAFAEKGREDEDIGDCLLT